MLLLLLGGVGALGTRLGLGSGLADPNLGPTPTPTPTPTPNQLCDRTARGRRLLRATATLLAPWSAATYRGRTAPYRTPVRGRVASQPMDSRLLGELT